MSLQPETPATTVLATGCLCAPIVHGHRARWLAQRTSPELATLAPLGPSCLAVRPALRVVAESASARRRRYAPPWTWPATVARSRWRAQFQVASSCGPTCCSNGAMLRLAKRRRLQPHSTRCLTSAAFTPIPTNRSVSHSSQTTKRSNVLPKRLTRCANIQLGKPMRVGRAYFGRHSAETRLATNIHSHTHTHMNLSKFPLVAARKLLAPDQNKSTLFWDLCSSLFMCRSCSLLMTQLSLLAPHAPLSSRITS